jgi:hypothetical protein
MGQIKNNCSVHPIFGFWFLVTFGDEAMKIQKYYVIFVYILQGAAVNDSPTWDWYFVTKNVLTYCKKKLL